MVRNHQFVTILNVITIVVAYCAINSLCPTISSLFITNHPHRHQNHHHGTILVADAAIITTTSSITNTPNSAFTNQNNTSTISLTTAVSQAANAAISNSNHSPSPVKSRYRTMYACEDRQLQIDCDEGSRINLIRANYGRFSISICNDHGHLDWNIDCMSPISFRIMQERCNMQRKCAVNASSLIFGDKCPKTRKYLEVHYQCQDIPQQQQNNIQNQLQIVPQQPNGISQIVDPFKSDLEQQPLFKPDPTINPPNQTPTTQSQNLYQSVSPGIDRTIMQDPRQLALPPTNTLPKEFKFAPSSQIHSPQVIQEKNVNSLGNNDNNVLVINPQMNLDELYQNLHLSIPAPMDTMSFYNGSEQFPYPLDMFANKQQQATGQGIRTIINSQVMSLSMMEPREKPIVLSEPLQITMRHIQQENISNPRCVLWDQQHKEWTTQGCQFRESNFTHTSCACEQLTNYAVVMDLNVFPTIANGQQSTITIINSETMSLSITGPILLADPVLITMRHILQDNVTNPRCVLWDQQQKDWTNQGCQHIESNITHTSCACDQLTYYAVFMDLNIHSSTAVPLAYLSHDPLWRTMTFCSFIIASVCLSITLITLLFMVRQQRRLANQRKQQRNNNYYYGASSYYQQQQKLSSASTSNNNTIYAPQQRANSQAISKQQEQSDYGQHQQKDQQKSSYTVINNYNNTSTSLVDDFMSSFPTINNNSTSLFDNSACLMNGNNNLSSSAAHGQLQKDTTSEIGMIIYKNLCLTILVVEFLYLVSVNHYNHHKLYCHVVSRLLHFALMATFMWCLIEAHELHKNLKSFLKSTTAINNHNHYKHSHHHRNQQANKLTSLLSSHQQQSSSPNPCLVLSGNQSHEISLMQHMLQLQQQQQQMDSPSAGSPTSSQDTNATTATMPASSNNTTTGPIPLIRGIMNCNSPNTDIQQSNAYWLNKNEVDYSSSNISLWTTKRSRYMHLIAYATPCVIVCITSFVAPQVYYYNPTNQFQQPLLINHCWLAASSFGAATVFSGQKLMSLAMAPMLLLLLAAATYLVMSVYLINKYNRYLNGYVGNGGGNLTSGLITTNHMTLTLKKQCDRKKFNDIRIWLKRTILLVLLVALTWTLALPYLIDSNNINLSQQFSVNNGLFQQQLLFSGGQAFLTKSSNYNQQKSAIIIALSTLIFACANALMGIFIFTTQCLQSTHVRHQYRLLFQQFSLVRFFTKLSLAPDSSSPSAKYPSNNGSTSVRSNGGVSSNQSSYSSSTLNGVGRHPMKNRHTLSSLRNHVISQQQHHLANVFGSGQQQQLAPSAAYLNNQIGEVPLDGQSNLIDGAQSSQLSPVQFGYPTLGCNATQVTLGLGNGNKLFQQQIYGLPNGNLNDSHYQANENSSIVSPMMNTASRSISTPPSNPPAYQPSQALKSSQSQQKGYHLTDEQSLTSSSDYGCRRLTNQNISQQLEVANNGAAGAPAAHDLSLLLPNTSHQQKDLYGEALALQQLSMSSPSANPLEVQNIIQQLLARQQQQQNSVTSKGLIQEHIYECIDDDNPYIAKLLLPTLYVQLSPEQQARAVATLARQLELGTTAVSPSSSSTQTMGGRASQQNHHQQMQMHMHQRSATTSPRALALASKILKSAVQQSALATGQNFQQQTLAGSGGQQRHFALPAIVRDNQKTNVICSKSTQQTTIGPQVATAINCNNITNNNQQQRSQQAHDIMAIYNSGGSTGGSASSNGIAPFSYVRSDKLSTDC